MYPQKGRLYDGFEHLQRLLFLEKTALMAMLTVYGDASGCDPAQPTLVLGGFLSTVEQWDLFNKKWLEVLRIVPTDNYHATDLEHAIKRWKAGKLERFQNLVAKTIKDFVAVGIATAIIKEDFEALKIRWHRIPQGKPGNHYFFCAQDFIYLVNRWAKDHGYKDPINYFLEAGDPGKGEVEKAFLALSKDPNFPEQKMIGAVAFEPKHCRVRPLEAADIWAYESYRLMMDVIMAPRLGKPVAPDRAMRRKIFKASWKHYNRYWDKDNLAEFAENAKAEGIPF